MLKQVLAAFTAVGVGIGAGRTLLSNELDRRSRKIIETSAVEARLRIRNSAIAFLKTAWIKFAIVTVIKITILACLAALYFVGLVSSEVTLLALSIALVTFLVRDVWAILPTARFILAETRRHGLHPHKVLKETVAALVYKEVLSEASAFKPNRLQRLMVSLSGRSQDEITQDIAQQVSSIATQSTWTDIKPFVASAVVMFGLLSSIYTATILLLLNAI